MTRRIRVVLMLGLATAMTGCDGKDPERLNRVGKKLVEKSRRFADDAELPRVTIEKPSKREEAPVVDVPRKK